MCADGVAVLLSSRALKRSVRDQDDSDDPDVRIEYVNGVAFKAGTMMSHARPQVIISETFFSRDVPQILWGAKDIKTIVFPNTVKYVSNCALTSPALKSVVLNEGLETLGECR